METFKALLFHINRSQQAYQYYINDKKYYQALRIRNANLDIYELLTTKASLWERDMQNIIIQYIFHLEDWFEQFSLLEKTNPGLTDSFIFERLDGSLPFPKEIIEKINQLYK